MSAIGTSLRWLVVPVSVVAVVGACIFGARAAISVVDRSCPAARMVGDACVAPWHTTAVEVAIYTAVALAALGLVLLPSAAAPYLKRAVAAVGFVIVPGALAWLAMASPAFFPIDWDELLIPFIIAAVFGGAALWWSLRRRRPTRRHSEQGHPHEA